MSIRRGHLTGCVLGCGVGEIHLFGASDGWDWRLRAAVFLFVVQVAIEVNFDFVNLAVDAI